MQPRPYVDVSSGSAFGLGRIASSCGNRATQPEELEITRKRVLIALALVLATTNGASAFNWNSKPSFYSEWRHQQARVKAGTKSGALSRREARLARAKLAVIASRPYRMSGKTQNELRDNSKSIYAMKHN